MYKMINLCQKPKSKENSCPREELKIINSEVLKIMGENYPVFIESRKTVYETIG